MFIADDEVRIVVVTSPITLIIRLASNSSDVERIESNRNLSVTPGFLR